jgi:DCN1-like protein 1/2
MERVRFAATRVGSHPLTASCSTVLRPARPAHPCSERQATQLLTAFSWKLEVALDSFFNDGGEEDVSEEPPARTMDRASVTTFFETYKADGADKIDVDGMQRLCEDLAVDPSDEVMLVLAWRLEALTMCEFQRAEFVNGMLRLGANSIASLKEKLPELRRELDNAGSFRSLYAYAFEFARSSEAGQKSLELSTAVEMWQLLLAGRFTHLSLWLQFLATEHTHAIPRDTWMLLYEFIESVDDKLSNYDENDSWPCLIDDFVTWAKPRLAVAA